SISAPRAAKTAARSSPWARPSRSRRSIPRTPAGISGRPWQRVARTPMPPAVNALVLLAALAQVPIETTVADLKSADRDTRLRAVRVLKEAARPDTALPLVPLIGDPDDEIQYE